MLRLRPQEVWFPPLALAWALAAGCNASAPPATSVATSVVLVSAATSTKEPVSELATIFEKQSGCQVRVNAGASNVLANQIQSGAPADVFLSANRFWAEQLDKPGLTVEHTPLLANRLVLIVPKGNPASVNGPADLLKSDVRRVALAGEGVPAGLYAEQALIRLKLYDSLMQAGKIARGQDVRSTLAYVERGEAEAGIVYSTDLPTAKNIETVDEFDPQTHDEIAYILVLLRHADGNAAAKDFYEFLASSQADAVWRKFGFERIEK